MTSHLTCHDQTFQQANRTSEKQRFEQSKNYNCTTQKTFDTPCSFGCVDAIH